MASAQLNNYITVETSICKIGKTRLDLRQIIKKNQNGHIFARLQVQAVWVELNKGARRLPQFLIKKLENIWHKNKTKR